MFRLNAKIVSGTFGRTILAEYFALVDNFTSAGWTGCSILDQRDRANLAPALCCSAGDAWRRIEFAFEMDPRWESFQTCHYEFQPQYNVARIHELVNTFEETKAACPEHYDDAWTTEVVKLLRVSPARGWKLMTSALLLLRLVSTAVERAHLPAEETRPSRARGRGLTPEMVALNTYITYATLHGKEVSSAVTEEVLKSKGLSNDLYSKFHRGSQITTQSEAQVSRALNATTRRSCGFDEFRHRHMQTGHRIGTPEFLIEKGRVEAMWRALSDADRAVWEGLSAGIDEQRQDMILILR